MIVAVVAMRVVQMPRDQIIDVVAVRHRVVPAGGTMYVTGLVATAAMVGGAAVGVIARDLDHMLVDVIFVRVMKVAIVQIVDMAAVMDGLMAATRPMPVGMVGVGLGRTSCHRFRSFRCPKSAGTSARLSAAWSMALRTNGSTCSSARA